MNLTKTQVQDKIISELPNKVHGILELYMRVGKTRICIEQLKKENPVNILWVTSSPKLRDIDIPQEFFNWNAKDLYSKTEIITYNKLSKLEGNYDVIILDEIQRLTLASAKNLLNGKIQYNSIIGLTGKMSTDKSKLELYEKLGLQIIKRVDQEDAIKLGLISDYTIHILNVKLSEEKDFKVKTKTISFLTSEKENYKYLTGKVEKDNILDCISYYFPENKIKVLGKQYSLKPFIAKFECDESYLIVDKESIGYIVIKDYQITGKIPLNGVDYRIENKDLVFKPNKFDVLNRMRFIYNLDSKLKAAKNFILTLKGRTICFSGSIEHANQISNNVYHSKSGKDNLNKFIKKEINLLSCVNAGGTGFTYDTINNLVIVQCNSDRNGDSSQKKARALMLDGNNKNIYIICAYETVDRKWTDLFLKDINKDKIKEYYL